ncbi:MAG: signal peptide peptidase SppA [Bdellovibrionales bacterium]|nr:signal peptide peptidase SppA [Bdellovibrionales bacterium]
MVEYRPRGIIKEYLLWVAKLITLLAIFVVVVPLVVIAVVGAADQAAKAKQGLHVSKDKRVAVIELQGMIVDSKEVLADLYKQSEDDRIKGIVLRVDSPGGAVGPSQEIYEAIKKLKDRKPIVVSMGSVAASGGLYVSLAASKIFCQPGTITGSIGVVMQVPNFTKLANQVGVDMITLKSGKLKDAGNAFRPMTEEERQYLETTLAEAHKDFIIAVARSRNLDPDRVVEFADGRILLGSQALKLKLVDEYGDVISAARSVFDILGAPLQADELPELYYPTDNLEKFRKLLSAISDLPLMLNRQLFNGNAELQYLMQ